MNLIPVIISGGIGSRLWPVSRESHPKPFIKLADGDSLISKTFQRVCALKNISEILTVTHDELFFKTEGEYEKSLCPHPLRYILEPFGRNTAAAVAAAALHVQYNYGNEADILIVPADHVIEDEDAFQMAVAVASELAEENWHVTFGVRPEYLETEFGYIEIDKSNQLNNGFKIVRFIEKPGRRKALEYTHAGNFYWNSGIFYFKAGTLLDDFEHYAPEVLLNTKRAFDVAHTQAKAHGDDKVIRLDIKHFTHVPNVSIDNAVMGKSEKMAMVPCNMGWSDVGNWSSIANLTPEDENQNRFVGDVISQGSQCNYVHSSDRLVALLGVENFIVVDTEDALLISHKDKLQEIKKVVVQLKEKQHSSQQDHKRVHRPWGTYTLLEEGERFKIKRIEVKPGGTLSLQMHHHRSEHWIVVSGVAKVLNDEDEFILNTNESTYIPAGKKHRLENPGLIDLVMIEVQSGGYLGEDDIIRFEDKYGRV